VFIKKSVDVNVISVTCKLNVILVDTADPRTEIKHAKYVTVVKY